MNLRTLLSTLFFFSIHESALGNNIPSLFLAAMVQRNFRHMPNVDEGEIVGLVSIRDVVKAHVQKLQAQLHFWKEYSG
jgi:predicted transcriptional regulator